jgi:PPOX class probable F420-dependent enzyme
MTDLTSFTNLASQENGLCVLSNARADGTIASSVVNAGVLPHPVTGEPVVGLVARGLRKLEHLHADPRATVVARVSWRWAGVEGAVEIFGPDDPQPGLDAEALRLLLRQVFVAAGGSHDDWDEYDRAMRDERSAVVLVVPTRTYPNQT